jgi:uroporphyrinogen-III decarboxylase
MNGYQRVAAALKGEWPDTTPVMLHNFMMAAHEAGVTMAQFRNDPEALARSFIQAVEKYRYDGIMIDVDTVTLAGAAGRPGSRDTGSTRSRKCRISRRWTSSRSGACRSGWRRCGF